MTRLYLWIAGAGGVAILILVLSLRLSWAQRDLEQAEADVSTLEAHNARLTVQMTGLVDRVQKEQELRARMLEAERQTTQEVIRERDQARADNVRLRSEIREALEDSDVPDVPYPDAVVDGVRHAAARAARGGRGDGGGVHPGAGGADDPAGDTPAGPRVVNPPVSRLRHHPAGNP